MRIDEVALYKRIGQKLRASRQDLKVSQGQLAKKVGVTRTSISNIESGIQKLPLQLLYRICAVLDLEVIYVLPMVSDLVKSGDDETIEIGGQVKHMSQEIASFVQEALEELSEDEN